jgi:hypothetical protein
MVMMILPILSLLVLSSAVPGSDLEGTAIRLRERAMATDTAYELARDLTVEIGPRMSGSDGDRRALVWGEAALARLGLKAVHREALSVPRWERGEASAQIAGARPQPLVLAALGGSVGTPEEGVTAEVVRFASLADLAAASREQVEGRIVFLDQKMRRTRDFSGYREAQPARTQGAAAAAKKGALAVVIRSVGTASDGFPHTGRVIYEAGTPPIPAAALASTAADLLAERIAAAAGGGEAVRISMRLTCRPLPNGESANLVAEIRGRELPDEIVLLGAHLDSWDLGPGALDDAAGLGIVLAAAHLLAELPRAPRRTIRVVLYDNEEFGLAGSQAYAEGHRQELARHVLALEADHGSDRVYQFAGEPSASGISEALLARLLAPLGIEKGGKEAGGSADLQPLREAGVPVFGLHQDSSRYFDFHHTQEDTLDKLDRQALRQVVAAYVVTAWLAAEAEPHAAGSAGPP